MQQRVNRARAQVVAASADRIDIRYRFSSSTSQPCCPEHDSVRVRGTPLVVSPGVSNSHTMRNRIPSNDFTCMSCISQLPLTRAWWSFDENLWESNDLATGEINVDTLIASGPGNPPILGMVRGGWQLNGVQDYIEVANDPKVNFGQGNFTFEGWIKLDTALTYVGSFVLVNKMAGSGQYTGYMIGLTNRRLTLSLANNGTIQTWAPSSTSPQVSNSDDNWHHVAVSVSRANISTGIRFFLDGQQVAGTGNASSRSGSLTNTAPLRLGIGLGSISAAPRIKVGVDEFRLYNSALSPASILSIYNAGVFGVCKDFERPDWWPIQ